MHQEVFSENQFDQLKERLAPYHPGNILLVRGKQSFVLSGAKQLIENLIPNAHELIIFDQFSPNPELEELKAGIMHIRQREIKLILAVGGGSVLDMAKLLSVCNYQKGAIEEILTGNGIRKENYIPVLAIPTTAGSGAEATQFAVLYKGKTKYSIEHPSILPNFVYLSAELTKSAPSYLTACSGADAFCQAVESVWCVNSNPQSEKFALKAAKLIWNHLPNAVVGKSAESRTIMLEASHLAGKAISITKTTAPHALSYAFTSFYGIAHGHAVALSLPFFLIYNYNLNPNDCNDANGAYSVKNRILRLLSVLDVPVELAQQEFNSFFNKIGISTCISEIIENLDPELILQHINIQRLKNNPRSVSTKLLYEFLNG